MAIVLRLVKGSALTHTELDGNFADLDGRADKAQVLLTGSTVLTSANHANRRIQMNSATATNIDMPAAPAVGDRYFGLNLGAGLLTLRTNAGGVLTGNALLPVTVDQYSPWEVWYTASGFIRVA